MLNLLQILFLKVYDRSNPKDIGLLEKLIKLYYTHGYYHEALSFLDIVTSDSLTMNFNVEKYINNCNFGILSMQKIRSHLTLKMWAQI